MNAKKVLVTLLAAVLLVGCTIGGTLAWLTAQTGEVTNTFTVGDINIDLKEHELVNGELTSTEVTSEDTYKVLPGTEQPKDPFVRIAANSEACWLFVKVDEKNNTVDDKKYVTYTVDTSVWTALDPTNYPGVYYKDLTSSMITAETTYNILTGNIVSYSGELTKADLNAVTDSTKPQLIFTAYAVQAEAAETAAEAWALAIS